MISIGYSTLVVNITYEVVGFLKPLVIKPLVLEGGEQVVADDLLHLLPLISEGYGNGRQIPTRHELAGHAHGPRRKNRVLLLQKLTSNVRAGHRDDVDVTKTDACNFRASFLHQLVNPPERRLVCQHLGEISNYGPWVGPRGSPCLWDWAFSFFRSLMMSWVKPASMRTRWIKEAKENSISVIITRKWCV